MTKELDALVENLNASWTFPMSEPNHSVNERERAEAAQAITDLQEELAASDGAFKEIAMELLKAKARAEALEHVIKTVTEDHKIQVARAEAAQKEVTDLALRNAELALKLLATEKEIERLREYVADQTERSDDWFDRAEAAEKERDEWQMAYDRVCKRGDVIHNAAIEEAAEIARMFPWLAGKIRERIKP